MISHRHRRTRILTYAILCAGIGALAMAVYTAGTKPEPLAFKELFYPVHVADSAGMKPVDYFEYQRGTIPRGAQLTELPTVFCVRKYDSGRIEDCGLKYQEWWKR